MADGVKGTVTSLASIISAEEAQKAAKRVEDAIGERQQELERVRHFAAENASLVNLVKKLPEELTHDIMVPFGKAAFFPGRLIHTNEFLVLLGDGYYAERTAKQTGEILQRRGKSLESQIDSLKAMISDYQAEASFFNTTAAEAAEGLMEIREDYVEEPSTEINAQSYSGGLQKGKPSGGSKAFVEDEEYVRLMSRLDELEEEELNASVGDEDEDEETSSQFLERELQVTNLVYAPTTRTSMEPTARNNSISNMEDLRPLAVARGESSHHSGYKTKLVSVKNHLVVAANKNTHDLSKNQTATNDITEHIPTVSALSIQESENEDLGHKSTTGDPNRKKAIIGSIVERDRGISSTPTRGIADSSQGPASNPSKPVSRFKLQKSGR